MQFGCGFAKPGAARNPTPTSMVLKSNSIETNHMTLLLLGVRSGADVDDQGFPCLSVLSLSEYVKLRQALVRCGDEARQTVHENLSSSARARLPSTFPCMTLIKFSLP
ncbi:hypothetical protein ElyMa_000305100 [Elysia marginata]|uniref:Uncharacterized protein n=1 Tax=Elysia marginata TaxID=1093978 RepID=A0AAV4FB99_9GAST|nr:hypothetical protein ElyMa_000305100 [Elysia marginata]